MTLVPDVRLTLIWTWLCVCVWQIPALGKHYSQRWAQEDLLEEQREGARANDKKKSILGPLSEIDAKGTSAVTLCGSQSSSKHYIVLTLMYIPFLCL